MIMLPVPSSIGPASFMQETSMFGDIPEGCGRLAV